MFQLILPFQLELPFHAQPGPERRRHERRRCTVSLPPGVERRSEERRAAS